MTISIGAKQYIDGVRSALNLQLARSNDIQVYLAEQVVGDFTFINCRPLAEKNDPEHFSERLFRFHVANALAEIILLQCERELISKELKAHHQNFSDQEREDICEKAYKVLNNCTEQVFSTYKGTRKTKLVQKILDYLEINNRLILEGFIRFRLKEYYEELRAAITVAVDEFLVEKEYSEFIRLLRYFVEIQEPKLETLHVLVTQTGGFQLYDDTGQIVTNNYLDGMSFEMIEDEITYEDLLISALITIAPEFIVLHIPQYKDNETIRTIHHVFGDRVSNCQGCQICRES